MKSAIYQGKLRHRRFVPKAHQFNYDVFMMYLLLDEVEQVLNLSPLWSKSRFAPARFKREDFHGDPSLPLQEAVKNTVEKALGSRPQGPVAMLANLRYFGFNMNPLTTYYCFAEDGGSDKRSDRRPDRESLCAIVAEVNNTPWDERHAYVLQCEGKTQNQNINFSKIFSVSPFNTLDMEYQWKSSYPGETLHIHIDNIQNNAKVLDATLSLKRKELSSAALNGIIMQHPFMTFKVLFAIYWQALKLVVKGVPFLGKDKLSKLEQSKLEQPTLEQ